MAAQFPWAWERCWAADPASTRWSGLAVTRATGISLHQKPGTLRGAMNRCLIFIAASKTGRGHLIQDIAEPADRYLSSRCRIRTRPLQPCLREYARLGFRFLKIKTRSEEHTSELQSLRHLVCRLLLEKKNDRSNRTKI